MPVQLMLCVRAGAETAIPGLSAGVCDALERLKGDGIREEDLLALAVASDGPEGAAMVFYGLHYLARRNTLCYRAEGDRGLLAVVSGASPLFELRQRPLAAGERHHTLSRFALLRRVGKHLVIETPFTPMQIEIRDTRIATLVMRLAAAADGDEPAGQAELSDEELALVFSLLTDCGVLTTRDEEEAAPLALWEFHDLLFHARTRFGRHLGGYGGTYHFRGRVPPLPAVKAAEEPTVELSTPDLGQLRREDVPFTEVLERRRSTRAFGDPPIDRRQLGEFLYRVARQRRIFESESGQELGSRPYPGGGALYELEIYLCVESCRDLDPGFYRYDPGRHRLAVMSSRPGEVDALLSRARQLSRAGTQVLLTIAARFGRMFWKYESMGYATILKDVGVLYQTMYLVAEAMGLGACALGGGDSDLLAQAAGLDYYSESAVGEFLIGSRA